MSKLVDELKRRNVFRVGAAYAVMSWLVIQVVDTIAPYLELPEWVPALVILLVFVGFPLVLIFAWAFELTEDGLQRTTAVDPSESITSHTGRKLNGVIILSLVIALGYFIWESRFSGRGPVPTQSQAESIEEAIEDKSIAVLPFADFSEDRNQEWFTDGLTDEILNSLVKAPDLNVASRTSSFTYKGSNLDVTDIGRELGVAHILEGSVRRSDSRLRVTAQLIRTSDGFHLWSQNYDRTPDDVIAIQEDLAISIAGALQTVMDPEMLADMVSTGTASVEAYNLYLEAKEADDLAQRRNSINLFEQAITMDPQFARAHYELAEMLYIQSQINQIGINTGLTRNELLSQAREHLGHAVDFTSDPVDALYYRSLQAEIDLRLRDSINLLETYLEQRPNDSEALYSLSRGLRQLGEFEQARAALQRAAALSNDSLLRLELLMQVYFTVEMATEGAQLGLRYLESGDTSELALYQTQRALLWDGEVDAAASAALRFRQYVPESSPEFDPDEILLSVNLRQACAEGRNEEAIELFNEASARMGERHDITGRWHAAKILGRDQEAEDLLHALDTPDQVRDLLSFMMYPQFDPRPYGNLMEILRREQAIIHEPVPLPFACSG